MEKPSLDKAKAGAVRFNTDSSQLEIYDGNQWTGILSNAGELLTGGVRGFFAGGNSTNIEFIAVDRTGNATDFGDLTSTMWINKCSASRSRGLIHGERPATTNIDFITIANAGTNASDFGDLTSAREDCAGVCNGTRAIFCGGGETNVIDYVSISQTGNAVDFGDLYQAVNHQASAESKTRGIIANGYKGPSPGVVNVIQYITMSTLGNSADFGDSANGGYGASGCGNAVTMLYNSGNSGSHTTKMNTLTIPTLGNSVFFGDLSRTFYGPGTASSRIRGVFAGDYPSGSANIEYVQLANLADAVDFGDLVSGRGHWGGSSNGHGGL